MTFEWKVVAIYVDMYKILDVSLFELYVSDVGVLITYNFFFQSPDFTSYTFYTYLHVL